MTMMHLFRLSLGMAFLLAVLLLGAGVAAMFGADAHYAKGDGLLVATPVKPFEDAPPGKRVAIVFSLTNRLGRPIRVVGATYTCGPHGCLMADNLPLEIPASESRQLIAHVETWKPGRFAGDLTMFTDSPGQQKITLHVTGRVTEDASKH